MRRYRLAAFVTAVCCLCAGCESVLPGKQENVLNTVEYGLETMSQTVDLSYEVPESVPNILTNQLGFEPGGSKTAVFRGEDLEGTFTVRNDYNDEIVYRGELKYKGYNETHDEYNSYGSFTEFNTPGTYYLQMDGIGESYRFTIRENLYFPLFERACAQFFSIRSEKQDSLGPDGGWQMEEKGKNRQTSASMALLNLLLSYELFPDVYTDAAGISESGNGIPDILDECRYEIEWLMEQAQTTPEENGTLSAYRAAVLAKAGYLYKGFDTAFASGCAAAAEQSWKAASGDGEVDQQLLFRAAAEIYRLNGKNVYRNVVTEYLRDMVLKHEDTSAAEFYGSVTYLNTTRPVEIELCDQVMQKLMEEAENISESSRQEYYMVCSDYDRPGIDVLLNEMIKMAVINHIITNHEYNTVIENHFHYLLGRNPDGLCYIAGLGSVHREGADIFSNPVQNSAFVFMMSELMSKSYGG